MKASQPSAVLARQVRHWRDERKLSAQALATRLEEIGSDLDRRAISKIENGTRGVSLDEWLQLAHALAVPPPLLFLDLASGADVAVAPEVALHPWLIWDWVTGELPPPVPSPRGGAVVSRVEEFGRAKSSIFIYRREQAAGKAINRASTDVRSAEYAGDEDALRTAKSAYVDALRDLAQALDDMVKRGMTPPGKPREWIETIRALGLSEDPDSLVIFEGQGGEDGGSDQEG